EPAEEPGPAQHEATPTPPPAESESAWHPPTQPPSRLHAPHPHPDQAEPASGGEVPPAACRRLPAYGHARRPARTGTPDSRISAACTGAHGREETSPELPVPQSRHQPAQGYGPCARCSCTRRRTPQRRSTRPAPH